MGAFLLLDIDLTYVRILIAMLGDKTILGVFNELSYENTTKCLYATGRLTK